MQYSEVQSKSKMSIKKSKPTKKSQKQSDREKLENEVEEELARYKTRLVEELKQGITLNRQEEKLPDQQVDELVKQLIKGVTKSHSIASNKIINPFVKLCKNLITQNQNDLDQVWEDCKEFLRENLQRFDDKKSKWLSSKEIIKKLEQENPLDYSVERKFYSIAKTRLEEIDLPDFMDTYNELDYYCNEIICNPDDDGPDSIMTEQRDSFHKIISLLFDLCIVIPKKLTK